MTGLNSPAQMAKAHAQYFTPRDVSRLNFTSPPGSQFYFNGWTGWAAPALHRACASWDSSQSKGLCLSKWRPSMLRHFSFDTLSIPL